MISDQKRKEHSMAEDYKMEQGDFEDVLENGVGRDFAYDVGEVMDALAKVL